MTAADPSLRRLSYPLRPGPFSEPFDLYLLPLSAISTSGTGSKRWCLQLSMPDGIGEKQPPRGAAGSPTGRRRGRSRQRRIRVAVAQPRPVLRGMVRGLPAVLAVLNIGLLLTTLPNFRQQPVYPVSQLPGCLADFRPIGAR